MSGMTRRQFLKTAGAAVLDSVVLYACGRTEKIISTLTPEPRYRDRFSLGSTTFEFDSTWTDEEKEELYSLYGKAYSPLRDFFDAEPVDRLNRPNVKAILHKEALTDDFGLVTNVTEIGDVRKVTLRNSEDHHTALHELAHLVWGSFGLLDTHLVGEGFPIISTYSNWENNTPLRGIRMLGRTSINKTMIFLQKPTESFTVILPIQVKLDFSNPMTYSPNLSKEISQT